MTDISFFQLTELKDSDLRQLFTLLVPDNLTISCIACGYINEKPIAIIAVKDDTIAATVKSMEGVTALSAADVPVMKYHITGNKDLLPQGIVDYVA